MTHPNLDNVLFLTILNKTRKTFRTDNLGTISFYNNRTLLYIEMPVISKSCLLWINYPWIIFPGEYFCKSEYTDFPLFNLKLSSDWTTQENEECKNVNYCTIVSKYNII